jgi:hypothetical protein
MPLTPADIEAELAPHFVKVWNRLDAPARKKICKALDVHAAFELCGRDVKKLPKAKGKNPFDQVVTAWEEITAALAGVPAHSGFETFIKQAATRAAVKAQRG